MSSVQNCNSSLLSHLKVSKLKGIFNKFSEDSNIKMWKCTLHKKWTFPLKDFFNKCDQMRKVTFTEEIFIRKIHFLCSGTNALDTAS